MNPLLELIKWIFTTKAGKFIFISVFGLIVASIMNILIIGIGFPLFIGCLLGGLIFAITDKSLTKWY